MDLIEKQRSGKLLLEDSENADSNNVLITYYHMKPVVYIGLVDTQEYKGAEVGSTGDYRNREKTLKRELNFKVVKLFDVLNNREVEKKYWMNVKHKV